MEDSVCGVLSLVTILATVKDLTDRTASRCSVGIAV